MIQASDGGSRYRPLLPAFLTVAFLAACSKGLTTAPSVAPLAWTLSFAERMDPGWHGLPAVGGQLYVVLPGGIGAVDKGSGTLRWKNQAWSGNYQSTNIALANDRVCAAADWDIGCYATDDGRTLWSIPLRQTPGLEGGGAFNTHTVVDDRNYYVAFNDGRVIAFDIQSGEPRWSTDVVPEDRLMVPIYSLLLSGDTLFATGSEWIGGSGDQSALAAALDKKTGNLIWRYNAPRHSGFIGAAILFRGNLIASDTYGRKLRAISTNTGTEVWTSESNAGESLRPENGPSASGDIVVVGSNDGYVYAFRWPGRKAIWRTHLGGAVRHAVTCGTKVIAHDFRLHILEVASGAPVVSPEPPADAHLLPDDLLVSMIGVEGTSSYVMGVRGLYKVRCD